METRRKMKLGTSDKIILGVGYTLLGLFVLAVLSDIHCSACSCWQSLYRLCT